MSNEFSNDIVLIKDMLLRLNDRQSDMKSTLSEIELSMDRLHKRIIGDEEYSQKGLIEEVNELKKYISKDKTLKNKFYGGIAAIAILWTFVWEFIKAKFVK